MTDKEKELLNIICEKVYFCLQNGFEKSWIAEQLDDVIYNLPDTTSADVLNELYRISDNLLLGGLGNEF